MSTVAAHRSFDPRKVGSLECDAWLAYYRREWLRFLRAAVLLTRTMICSQVAAVLDRVRAREPRARVGISIGGRIARASQRWRDWRVQVLAGLQAGRWDALMAQHRLVDFTLLEDVVARSGLLYAWTVNERTAIDALRRLGVHGIATADPRLFTA